MKSILPFGSLLFAAAIAAPSHADDQIAGPADQDFMKKAAQANIAEIEAGRLAQNKATREDLKRFGEQMQQDHEKVLDELHALAKSKSVVLPTSPDESHKAMARRLSQASGTAFDKAYATQAGVADHKAAKALFETGASSKDPDVSAFAKKVLPDIEHHLEMAQKLAQQ